MHLRATTAASVVGVLLQALFCKAKHNWTDNSKLIVQIPANLYDSQGSLHFRIPFGKYPRAKTHSDFVYYVNDTLCFNWSPKNGTLHGYPGQTGGSFILMVNGGHCSAVKKTRRAQEMGASGVLIAEPHCTCWDTPCTEEFPDDTCDNEQTAVTNDGSADDITIPSFIVFKSLREKLVSRMVEHKEPVMVEMQWDLESDLDEGSKPTIHFWTSAYDEKTVSVDTYMDLQVVTQALAPYAKFEPRFVLFNGTDFGCDGSVECGDMCTNKGKYCTLTQPQSTGMARMKETLRRLCVFRHYTLEQYWKYAIYHKENCEGHGGDDKDEKCWEKGFKHAGIRDHGTIEQCFKDTGGLEDDKVNDLLDESLHHIQRAGVMPYPALSVDRNTVEMFPASLLEAVCSQYWFSNVKEVPKVCEKCGSCFNAVGCLQHGKCVDFSNKQRYAAQTTGSSHHGWKLFGSLVLLSGLGAVAYYAYDKYRDQLRSASGRSPMGGLLNDYMQLGQET